MSSFRSFHTPPNFVKTFSKETKSQTKTFTVLSFLFSCLPNMSLHHNTKSLPKPANCTFLRLSVGQNSKILRLRIYFYNGYFFRQNVTQCQNILYKKNIAKCSKNRFCVYLVVGWGKACFSFSATWLLMLASCVRQRSPELEQRWVIWFMTSDLVINCLNISHVFHYQQVTKLFIKELVTLNYYVFITKMIWC